MRIISKHASVFDFALNDQEISIPASRTRRVVNTGSAHSIRQRPYRVSTSERKIIAQQMEEILAKKVIQESCNL